MSRAILTDDYVRSRCRRSKNDPIEMRKLFISGKMTEKKYMKRMDSNIKKRFPQLYNKVINPALEHGIPLRRTGEIDDALEYLDANSPMALSMYEDLFEDASSMYSEANFEDAMSMYSDETEFFDVEEDIDPFPFLPEPTVRYDDKDEDEFYDTTEAPGRRQRRTYAQIDRSDRVEYFDSGSGIGSAQDTAYQIGQGSLPPRQRSTPSRYGRDEFVETHTPATPTTPRPNQRQSNINRRRFDLTPPVRRIFAPTP